MQVRVDRKGDFQVQLRYTHQLLSLATNCPNYARLRVAQRINGPPQGKTKRRHLCDGANVPGDLGSEVRGLMPATLLNDSKVKQLTIDYRDSALRSWEISRQYSAPEMAWPCIY
jgi:hypothetical protein